MKSDSKVLLFILIFFGFIFSLISLVNHFYFRTYALDLGMINHALYNFSRGEANYFTQGVSPVEMNYLADHFSPIIILLSPMRYILGSYTLLLVQIACILAGGIGIYKSARFIHPDTSVPLWLTVHFFSIWGIYSALSFDFHTNVIAAMILPWLYFFYVKNDKPKVILCAVLMILCKENMALWTSFIFAGLAIKKWISENNNIHKISNLKFELSWICLSLLYFFVVVDYIMPWLRGDEGLSQLYRYSFAGNSLPEIIWYCILHPGEILQLLYSYPGDPELATKIKSELYFMIAISGGLALIARPYFLLMLIPIFAQKLLSSDPAFWGINYQYSIEFVPVLSLCVAEALLLFNIQYRTYIAGGIVILTMVFTIHKTESRESIWYNRTNTAFYSAKHYSSDLNREDVFEAMALIPDTAVISVSSSASPRLSFRKKIYLFPIVKDAQYILLMKGAGNAYPLKEEEFVQSIDSLKTGNVFQLFFEKKDVMVFKRK